MNELLWRHKKVVTGDATACNWPNCCTRFRHSYLSTLRSSRRISHLIDDEITVASVGMNSLGHLGDLLVVAFFACVFSACSAAVLRCLPGKPDRSAMTGLLDFVVLPPTSSSHLRNYTRGSWRRGMEPVLSPAKANSLLYEEEVPHSDYPPRSAIVEILFFSKLQLVYQSHISRPRTIGHDVFQL